MDWYAELCARAGAATDRGDPWAINPCLVLDNWELYVDGVWMTVRLTLIAMTVGFVLAVPLALARVNRQPLVDPFARAFVYVFRGSPLLVQTFLVYYGLAQFDFVRDSIFWRAPDFVQGAAFRPYWPSLRDAYWCALLAFSLNSAAYQAEILRGAVAATPRGEVEAATAFGMSRWLAARRIIIPSALRRSLPQMGNEVVFMLHGSAVASVITLQDILGVGRTINGKYYVAYEGFLSAALLYMVLTYATITAFRALERRYLRHLRRS